MAFDLGGLLGDLGTAYISSLQQPISSGLNGSGVISATPALGLPFVDVIPEQDACAKGYVWNPAANCGAGKWQKKSRRRRKRLATMGDLKDLAALKGILGQGKAFEVWIATHA